MVRYDYDRGDYTDRFRDEIRRDDQLESMVRDLMREVDRPEREEDPLTRIVNDPSITLTPTMVKAINNPKVMMNRSGGLETIRSSGQFTNMGIPLPVKRTRKKTQMDKTMSRCLKIANSKLRLKNGKLKKGKTMSDVMKMAHRLCKK